MSKLKKTILILVAIFLVLGGYFLISFTMFSPPKITFFSTNQVNYALKKRSDITDCYHAEQQTEVLNQSEFQLLVWNIHKGQDAGWQDTLHTLSHNADLLLLQEISSQQHLETLLEKHFPYFVYAVSFAYHNTFSGVGTLAKFAPQTYCASATKEPWIKLPKVGVATTYPLLNGKSLLVVNLHLVNFEWNPTNYQQQLTEAFNLIATHQGPIILAGDFNTWNKRRLRLVEELANKHHFRPVSFSPDVRLHFMNNPLDHIFVKGLSVLDATTLETESSDHNPLLIKLKLD